METFPTTSSRIPRLVNWCEEAEDYASEPSSHWLTRRFGLSPTFARRVADLAFTVTRRLA
jgi:hypothetical protein